MKIIRHIFKKLRERGRDRHTIVDLSTVILTAMHEGDPDDDWDLHIPPHPSHHHVLEDYIER